MSRQSRYSLSRIVLWIAVGAVAVGCATARETSIREQVASSPQDPSRTRASAKDGSGPGAKDGSGPGERAGTLGSYLARALKENPEVRAAFSRWKARVHRIARARRLPEPTLSFGYFIQSVETRVGPQRARIGLQQSFPWPTKLTAGADSAAAEAQAAEQAFEARALSVRQRVAEAYWNLWVIRETRRIHRDHLVVLRGLSETTRARFATGAVDLAEHQQIDLTANRLEDAIRSMDEAERAAAAQLRAAVGLAPSAQVPTTQGPPPARLPRLSEKELAAAVRAHPHVESFEYQAEAKESSARAEAADRLPSFTVGADWILTGEAAMADVSGSGKDAVIVAAGVRLPLWQGSYSESIEAAQAEADSHRYQKQSAIDQGVADVEAALAKVRDSVRQVEFYHDVLLPQAQSTYTSVLGSYASGRGSVAQALLAQRDLLELRVEYEQVRARHARAWAQLEEVTARELDRKESKESER